MPDALNDTIPELYNPQTLRLDGKRVAEYLHLRVSDIANIVGCSDQDVRKHSDAPSFQGPLRKLAFIVNGLLELTGENKEQVLIWLNAPHPVLDYASPLDLMRGKKIDVVVDLVDDMLSGAPA